MGDLQEFDSCSFLRPCFSPFSVLQVWNHFDSGSCPGQAIGVRSRMDNGVTGFIPTKFLSDKVVKHPEERVKVRNEHAAFKPSL